VPLHVEHYQSRARIDAELQLWRCCWPFCRIAWRLSHWVSASTILQHRHGQQDWSSLAVAECSHDFRLRQAGRSLPQEQFELNLSQQLCQAAELHKLPAASQSNSSGSANAERIV
jgi:hypothetical protein